MEFITKGEYVIFIYHYTDRSDEDWVRDKLYEEGEVSFKRVLHFEPSDVYEINCDDFEGPFSPVAFRIARLNNDYYYINPRVLRLKNKFFFHKDIQITRDFLIAETNISILRKIDNLVKEDIYIGGKAENNIPLEIYQDMIRNFPNTYEKNLYSKARISSIITNYFDTTKDAELKYQKYLNKKKSKRGKNLIKHFQEYELHKYQVILNKLIEMLHSENNYTEAQWQEEILEIILLLYPKYILSFKTVHVKINNCNRRFLDFMLVDTNGHVDVIEIKKPFDNVLMTSSQYRNNFTPHRTLTGTVMQLEKYLFHLNRYGEGGEAKLTQKYKNQLPKGLTIKIVNPKGIIIMGRSERLNDEQKMDFEIVKRKYQNVIDILTYDDLIQRLKFLIGNFQKRKREKIKEE